MTALDAAPAAADPLIALEAAQSRLVRKINALGRVDADVTPQEHARLSMIEDRIEALVPRTPAGAIALVHYLKFRMEGFAWCEVDDQILDNLVAGLKRLERGDFRPSMG